MWLAPAPYRTPRLRSPKACDTVRVGGGRDVIIDRGGFDRDSRFRYGFRRERTGHRPHSKGSRAANQPSGIASRPLARTTTPPTIAQLVSLSPPAETVAQRALASSSRCRAAHQRANGTVSGAVIR